MCNSDTFLCMFADLWGEGVLLFNCAFTGHTPMSVSTSSLLVNIWMVSLDLYQEVALMLTEYTCILHLWRLLVAQADASIQSQARHTKRSQTSAFLPVLGILGFSWQFTQDSVCGSIMLCFLPNSQNLGSVTISHSIVMFRQFLQQLIQNASGCQSYKEKRFEKICLDLEFHNLSSSVCLAPGGCSTVC